MRRIIIMMCVAIWCMQANAQQPKPQTGKARTYSRTMEWIDTVKLNPEKLIGEYQLIEGMDTLMEIPPMMSSMPWNPPMQRYIMHDGQWEPMKEGSYRDTTFNPNDTLRRDSTLGLALFVDTLFTLQSAICLRIRESKRHSYGKGWFYDDPATETYLSLVDGQWVQDLDDRLFLIFVPRKQFQDGKKKGVNEK